MRLEKRCGTTSHYWLCRSDVILSLLYHYTIIFYISREYCHMMMVYYERDIIKKMFYVNGVEE